MSPTSYQTAPPRGGPSIVRTSTRGTKSRPRSSLRLRRSQQLHELGRDTPVTGRRTRHRVRDVDVVEADLETRGVAAGGRTHSREIRDLPRDAVAAVHQVR